MPEVSIILPSYNCENYISDTINSVIEQTFTNWELIVIDDCSRDKTISIVQDFVNVHDNIFLIKLKNNCGPAVARNRGIDFARGRFISFLDGDDLWLPKKLEIQLTFMKNNNYVFTYTSYDKIDYLGNRFEHVGVPSRVSYFDLLKTCSIGCLSAIYDTSYFGKIHMPLIRKRQDYGLWLILLKSTNFAYGINTCLAQYRVHQNSISSNKFNVSLYTWRLFREFEGLGFFPSLYYFLHYSFRGLLRTKFPSFARKIGILN